MYVFVCAGLLSMFVTVLGLAGWHLQGCNATSVEIASAAYLCWCCIDFYEPVTLLEIFVIYVYILSQF